MAAAPDIFLAGVIQGSLREPRIVDQDYRAEIKAIVRSHAPGLTIYDPIEHHPRAVEYPLDEARRTFLGHVDLVRRSRAVIAYLPEASLGTAIEMWEAHGRGIPVVAISPMRENWVVRLLSNVTFCDVAEFGRWVSAGELERMVTAHEKDQGCAG